ncbi:calcineurin-like phosphoesterase family protein [uncultured Alistipes sp.]|jgi:calcineurin-like phosphoesterase|uniref:calcineurin-like phosphoesterase family protein n=1 Tax=uncultured Alistipes sp. TaxID=538949 RepID=UPI0025F8417D|nr:calcineurin-like phosphoesterase family protein [uncultured Alistipes sp.]
MKLFLYRLLFIAALLGGLLSGACSDSDEKTQEVPREHYFVVALLDEAYDLDYEGELTLRILKFADGDRIALTPGERDESAEQTFVELSGRTDTGVTFRLPKQMTTGRWSIWCLRGDQSQFLGTTTLNVDIFRLVRNVRLEESYNVDREEVLTIPGEGFTAEDIIRFSEEGESGAEAKVVGVDAAGIALQLPATLRTGVWEIWCERGADSQLLGMPLFTVSAFDRIDPQTLPDGTNLYGRVYCASEALADICVSDGLQIVRTNADGIWSMVSDRALETVFVTLPGGYEIAADGPVPQFYHLLSEERDRYDFALSKTGSDEYVLLATADIQIDNAERKMVPQSSLVSCRKQFLPDFQKTISELGGRKVYALSVGDMIFDKHMYQHNFGFSEYRALIGEFGIPFFHAIGNHDYDRYRAGDFATKEPYRRTFGPTYYSVNLGQVHCIALDNVRIDNNGASQGVFGDGYYAIELSDRQLQWLEADLATVTDKTAPLLIWMHVPLTACRQITPALNSSFRNAQALIDRLQGFTDVIVISGHWHNNHTGVCPGNEHIREHNLGAVCGSLWYNVKGFNGGQDYGAGTDGSPMGYAIYEISGRNISWSYKACDLTADNAFTAYDMNTLPAGWKDKSVTNEILVNVWGGWDAAWKVEVLEDDRPLAVKREMRRDPNYLRYVREVYIPSGDDMSKSAASAHTTPHMFSAVTADAQSSVLVRVTDRFGKVYTKRLRE